MYNNNLKFVLTVFAILLATAAFSQPPPPPYTPIDSGVSVLLAIGIGYGVKKLREKR